MSNIYMIVDDCNINLKILSKFIIKADPESIIIECKDGPESIDTFISTCESNYKINAIIMDLQMPNMNGDVALDKINDYHIVKTGNSLKKDGIVASIFTANIMYKREDLPNDEFGIFHKPITKSSLQKMLGLDENGSQV